MIQTRLWSSDDPNLMKMIWQWRWLENEDDLTMKMTNNEDDLKMNMTWIWRWRELDDDSDDTEKNICANKIVSR